MFGLNDFLFGGLLPMAVAAIAYAAAWAASRHATVGWNAGIVVGYATGVTALEAQGVEVASAVRLLAQPAEAKHWAPAIALIAVAPTLWIALAKRRRWAGWLLAAIVCSAAPVWLLWGTSYLPSAEVRASGFATNAWSAHKAVAILAGTATALFAGWYSWKSVPPGDSPKVRSFLTVLAVVAAAATAGLTGSFVYAQLFGVLAASIGGCSATSWLIRNPSGPETAAGPIILLAGCLLFLPTFLSNLQPLQAVGLAIAIVLAAGWLPKVDRLGTKWQQALRVALVMAPLAAVVWGAGAAFIETQRQQEKAAEDNPYLNL